MAFARMSIPFARVFFGFDLICYLCYTLITPQMQNRTALRRVPMARLFAFGGMSRKPT